ncbi:MAG: alkaline phosphatase family protein [Planctomycetes bacterium]|nr:alkaline phosphatase family protein [Planctomycetota bacterium]
MAELTPLVVLNVVGLTPALLAHAPRLARMAARPMRGVFPALTMTAQATMLTGALPREHGVVANGWYWRGLGEVRNWVQSNALLGREPFYRTAARLAAQRGLPFTCAKMFWWFNQGSGCSYSVTPKPHYGSDGSKEFDILSEPPELAPELQQALGRFPFFSFWGPRAGLPSSRWIAQATAHVLRTRRPTLTLCYLPHLDYDLQRKGAGADTARLVRELDDCAALVLEAAAAQGARVLVVSEYGISPVARPVYVNRTLREAGLLRVRHGPFGEVLDPLESRAFAVCDHQCAHVYVREAADQPAVASRLRGLPGVDRVLDRAAQAEFAVDHPNAGELVLLSARDAWFAYSYWLDDTRAPDFARSVDIHRKPGYDPCELLVDPALAAPGLRAGLTLLRKKLGLRYRMSLTPLDASLVKGSHGLPAARPEDGPLLACSDAARLPAEPAMTDLPALALRLLGLSGS